MKGIHLVKAGHKDLTEFLFTEKSIRKTNTYSATTDEKEAKAFLGTNEVYLIKKGMATVGNISYTLKGRKAHISGLVIVPKFQGKGIGRIALMLILKKLKKRKSIELVTHPQNSRALSLYLSLGFTIQSWKNNYFGDGEPRLILTR